MLAKISLGFAVVSYGLDALEDAYERPAILGQRDDIGMWVGSPSDQLITEESGLHVIETMIPEGGIASVRVKLFAQLGGPEYEVVVGRLSETWLAAHPLDVAKM